MPPTRAQVQAAVAISLVLLAAFLATPPVRSVQFPATNVYIPVINTALLLSDVITATLLFGQYSVLRSPPLLALAVGYMYTGLIMIPHALTFLAHSRRLVCSAPARARRF